METIPTEEVFSFTGGELCLDFTNTVGWRPTSSGPELEHLTGYPILVAWGRQAGTLSDALAERLLARAAQAPDEAERVLAGAIALREAIYRLFSAIAAEREPAPADLEVLNVALAGALAHSRVVRQEEGFAWGWAVEEGALDQMLWPVARSAGELLTSDERKRVRECGGHDCSWLFLDMSRNQSRQWCDMQSCGNRAKARRHYQKRRAGASLH